MQKSIGLLILTELPDLGRVAILQIRGEFNHETMKAETFPGGCQATCHGKAEQGECLPFALFRELDGEIGKKAADMLYEIFHPRQDSGYVFCPKVSESSAEGPTEIATTYAVIMPPDILRIIRLSPSSGGLRLLKENEIPLIQNLRDFDRSEGVIDRRVIAMIPDEKQAVQKAFETFKSIEFKPESI